MKQTSRYRVFLVLIALQLSAIISGFSQVQTARYISTSSNSNGFYEYLPPGYSSGGSETYPLLIFIHGVGELGNGASDLPTVLRNGPPRLANNRSFPFNASGTSYKFILISPQFVDWPSAANVNAVIDYAIAHYHVNVNRIYLTGLSMGGGAVWDYVGDNVTYGKRIAAIVPVCGASEPYPTSVRIIASLNLPIWATHNQDDPTVPVENTNNYISQINNSIPAPVPLARKTIFAASGHDAWSRTYDPTFTENGMNVYQWMQQYELNAVALPIVLGDYKAFVNETGTVTIKWTTVSETNNKNFVVERSLDGSSFNLLKDVVASNEPTGHQYSVVDSKPSPGNNFYRLSQIDKDGKTTYFNIIKVILPVSDNQRYFHLSPNPVINTLVLDLINPVKTALQVSLTDIQGHQLKVWKFQKSNISWQQSIDVSGIPKGNYIIQISGNGIHEVQRFVKQ